MISLKTKLDLISSLKNYSIYKGQGLSNSMQPLIEENDLLTIKKMPFSFLRKGDIIAFNDKKTARIMVHRVVKIDKEKTLIITKGDNLKTIDNPIHKSDFLGKAVFLKNSYYEFSLEDWRSKVFGFAFYNIAVLIFSSTRILKLVKKIDFYLKRRLKRILFHSYINRRLCQLRLIKKN